MKRLSAILLVGALVFGTVGCTNMNKTQQGLLSGAAGGAILGAGLGALTGGSGTTGALIGGGLGLIAGFLGIPAFLLVVLQGMYVMPGLRLEYDWLYGSLGIALFVVGVLAATIYACVQEMRQTPASLLRPKAPRAGSRILLERIRPVWNRIGFLGKVTARNIFRFKSRLIMTVVSLRLPRV